MLVEKREKKRSASRERESREERVEKECEERRRE